MPSGTTFSPPAEEYGADMADVFYAFKNKRKEGHQFILFLMRFGAAAPWFVFTAGLTLAGWKLFKCEEA